MAWLKLHQTLTTNKKTLTFRNTLKIKTPQAIGHLCMLWLWALDNADDGDLSIFSDEIIAEVSGWIEKDTAKYVNALRTAGFLDEDNTIHDWSEYTGKLIEKRKSEAVRQKNIRAKNKNNTQYVRSTEDVRNEDDTQYESCTEDVCTENVPPLKSRVDKSRVDKSTPPNPLTGESGEGESVETNIIDCSTQLKECQQIVESAEKMFLPNLATDITMRLRDGVEFEVIKELLLIAVGKDNPTAYFAKMAQSYYARGIKTYADYCKEKGIEIAKPKAEMSVEERRIAAGFKP